MQKLVTCNDQPSRATALVSVRRKHTCLALPGPPHVQTLSVRVIKLGLPFRNPEGSHQRSTRIGGLYNGMHPVTQLPAVCVKRPDDAGHRP